LAGRLKNESTKKNKGENPRDLNNWTIMDKTILKELEGKKLTWVFVQMKSGLIFGVFEIGRKGDEFIGQLKWEDAYRLETQYDFDFNNSMVKFVRERTNARSKDVSLLKINERYQVMNQKDWNKIKKPKKKVAEQICIADFK